MNNYMSTNWTIWKKWLAEFQHMWSKHWQKVEIYNSNGRKFFKIRNFNIAVSAIVRTIRPWYMSIKTQNSWKTLSALLGNCVSNKTKQNKKTDIIQRISSEHNGINEEIMYNMLCKKPTTVFKKLINEVWKKMCQKRNHKETGTYFK